MLQVTFKDVLPCERLLELVNRPYGAWRKSGAATSRLTCQATIRRCRGGRGHTETFVVSVEVALDPDTVWRVSTTDADPSVAVRNAMASAEALALGAGCVRFRAPDAGARLGDAAPRSQCLPLPC